MKSSGRVIRLSKAVTMKRPVRRLKEPGKNFTGPTIEREYLKLPVA